VCSISSIISFFSKVSSLLSWSKILFSESSEYTLSESTLLVSYSSVKVNISLNNSEKTSHLKLLGLKDSSLLLTSSLYSSISSLYSSSVRYTENGEGGDEKM